CPPDPRLRNLCRCTAPAPDGNRHGCAHGGPSPCAPGFAAPAVATPPPGPQPAVPAPEPPPVGWAGFSATAPGPVASGRGWTGRGNAGTAPRTAPEQNRDRDCQKLGPGGTRRCAARVSGPTPGKARAIPALAAAGCLPPGPAATAGVAASPGPPPGG